MKEIKSLCLEEGYKKAQLLYVLYVLERYTDKHNTLTQAQIADKVKQLCGEFCDENVRGERTELRSIGRCLRILKGVGYNMITVQHGQNLARLLVRTARTALTVHRAKMEPQVLLVRMVLLVRTVIRSSRVLIQPTLTMWF